MEFHEIAHGWLQTTPNDEAIRAAKQRADDTLALSAPITMTSWWTGYLAELAAIDWLEQQGHTVTHHGGVDILPDLQVGGLGLDVKCRDVKCGRFRPHYEVSALATDLAKPAPSAMLHMVYSEQDQTLLFLGGIRTERFYTEARFIRAGQPLGSGHPAQHDNFLLPASNLTPPAALPIEQVAVDTPGG
jgi:hypothetical protein